MAWPTVPSDITDGDVLSATFLNQLAACAAFLNAVGGVPNLPFEHIGSSRTVTLRHRHRYFHLIYTSSNSDYLVVTYNGTEIINNQGPTSGTVVVDLETEIPSLVVGEWYNVVIEIANHEGGYLDISMVKELSTS
jgi:hypothetical protein